VAHCFRELPPPHFQFLSQKWGVGITRLNPFSFKFIRLLSSPSLLICPPGTSLPFGRDSCTRVTLVPPFQPDLHSSALFPSLHLLKAGPSSCSDVILLFFFSVVRTFRRISSLPTPDRLLDDAKGILSIPLFFSPMLSTIFSLLFFFSYTFLSVTPYLKSQIHLLSRVSSQVCDFSVVPSLRSPSLISNSPFLPFFHALLVCIHPSPH